MFCVILRNAHIAEMGSAERKLFLTNGRLLAGFVVGSASGAQLVKIMRRLMMTRSESGYEELFTGTFVAEEDAFDYALENCVEIVPERFYEIEWKEEFKKMLVEWFYSGGEWTRVAGYGTD